MGRSVSFSSNENQPLSFGLFGRFSFPVGVALDFLKTRCLEIMHEVPVGEESEAFSVFKDVYALRSIDNARLLPPSNPAHRIKVAEANDFSVLYACNLVFIYKETFRDPLNREPLLAQGIGIANITN